MTDVKVSALPAASTIIGTETLPCVQGGVTKIVTVSGLRAGLGVFDSTNKGLVPASGGGTTNYLRADGSFAQPPGNGTLVLNGAKVTKSGTQSIAHNTITAITFDVENTDTNGFHSTSVNTSRLTMPAGVGGVRVDGQVTFDFPDGVAYYDCYLALYKNGAITEQSYGQSTGAGLNYLTLRVDSGPVATVPGDYYELFAYCFASSGTAAGTIRSANHQTSFQAQVLG